MSSLDILNTNLLSDMFHKNIFSPSVVFFSFTWDKLLIFMKLNLSVFYFMVLFVSYLRNPWVRQGHKDFFPSVFCKFRSTTHQTNLCIWCEIIVKVSHRPPLFLQHFLKWLFFFPLKFFGTFGKSVGHIRVGLLDLLFCSTGLYFYPYASITLSSLLEFYNYSWHQVVLQFSSQSRLVILCFLQFYTNVRNSMQISTKKGC